MAHLFSDDHPVMKLDAARLTALVLGLGLTTLTLALNASAQDRIYRCGNEYTNTLPAGNRSHCKLLEGAEVTVVPAAPRPLAMSKPVEAPERGMSEARGRDSEARQILEAELRKARAKRDELLSEYNNGEPEKMGSESRNHQKYLDRVAAMKSAIDRVEQDINGIHRELGRHAAK
jgi:hypothetical protein